MRRAPLTSPSSTGMTGNRPTGRGGSRTFDTALGLATVAWTPRGVSRVELPARSRRKGRVGTGPVPAEVRRLMAEMKEYFRGKDVRPRATLDLAGATSFQRAVYERAREIPRGAILTYGELAEAIGRPGAARAVGQALGRNPVPVLVPCHRIVAATGGLGGFSAAAGVDLKKKMLILEGVGAATPGTGRSAVPFLEALLSRPRRAVTMGGGARKNTGVGGRRRRRTG